MQARERPSLEASQAQHAFVGAGLLRREHDVLLATGHHDGDRQRGQRSPDVFEKAEGLCIRCVEIVEDDRERARARDAGQKGQHRLEQAKPRRIPRARQDSPAARRRVWNDPGQVRALHRAERLEGLGVGVEELAQYAGPAPVGRRALHESPGRRHLGPRRPRTLGQELGRAGLPDASLAGEEEDATVTREGRIEGGTRAGEDLAPTDVQRCRIVFDGRIGLGLDGACEAIAATGKRDDGLGIAGRIADRAPRQADRPGERRLRDDGVRPDGGEQLVLRNRTVSVVDQTGDQLEDLRLDRDDLPFPSQLEARRVELVMTEGEPHRLLLPPMRSPTSGPRPERRFRHERRQLGRADDARPRPTNIRDRVHDPHRRRDHALLGEVPAVHPSCSSHARSGSPVEHDAIGPVPRRRRPVRARCPAPSGSRARSRSRRARRRPRSSRSARRRPCPPRSPRPRPRAAASVTRFS